MSTAEAAVVDTRTLYAVLRPFHGGGMDRYEGEVVDGSRWRGAERLCDMRYMRLFTYEDVAPIETDGRMFLNNEAHLAFTTALLAGGSNEDAPEVEAEKSAFLNGLLSQSTPLTKEI